MIYNKTSQTKKMILIAIILISTVSHSIAYPIPQYNHELISGSGYDSGSDYDSGSGSDPSLKHNAQNTNNENHQHHSCKTACKVFTYILLIIIGYDLLGFCCLLTTMVYECCIKDICIDCSHLIQGCCLNIKNNCSICAFFKLGKQHKHKLLLIFNILKMILLQRNNRFHITINSTLCIIHYIKMKNPLIQNLLFVSTLSTKIFIHFIVNTHIIKNV